MMMRALEKAAQERFRWPRWEQTQQGVASALFDDEAEEDEEDAEALERT